MKQWSNLAKVIARRTYNRTTENGIESWNDTVTRAVMGNVAGRGVPESETKELIRLANERKASFAGRGLWFSGTGAHQKLGGAALNNCWFITADDWNNYVIAQDLLMLGGGVGMSVEHRFTSKLPKVKKNVKIVHRSTKDADFIVPDSREGWCKLNRRALESFLVTGRSFSYSTICLRGYGEAINGFGGTASGPIPLIEYVSQLCELLVSREGKHIRPIDAADILTLIAGLVKSGNVRRSATIVLGDAFDKEFLKAKRFDLGGIPAHRGNANYSIVVEDADDLTPLFWKTYDIAEPFGIVNRKNIQKFGRMGELLKDTAVGVNPCAEACLENGEPCNLVEIALSNLEDEREFERSARLYFRAAKRVTLDTYHHAVSEEVVKRNRRVGLGITGCMASPLFNANTLDNVYAAILDEDEKYSRELGVSKSIRHTVVKPSGTMSKVMDCDGYEGIHPAYSRYIIQRVRFGSNDPLIPKLRAAGHVVGPEQRNDNTLDHGTQVVEFYLQAPEGYPIADEDWDTWKQLDVHRIAQQHWADQAVSVTVYYKREELTQLKQWMADNLQYLKTISFLCHSADEFPQMPKEAITREQYEKAIAKIKPIDVDDIGAGEMLELECASGACPVR